MYFPNRRTEIGQKIDNFLNEKVYYKPDVIRSLFSQNRWEMADLIKSTLLSGKNIVCDRYYYSGIAYSVANGVDFAKSYEEDIGLPQPDIVFYLKADVDITEGREIFTQEVYERPHIQETVSYIFDAMFSSDIVIPGGEGFYEMTGNTKFYILNAKKTEEEIHEDVCLILGYSEDHFI